MILNSESQRPEIDYPCEWSFKVIGENVNKMVALIEKVVEGMSYDLQASNISKKGKYKSLNLKVYVESETDRNFVYGSLSKSEDVKMVL